MSRDAISSERRSERNLSALEASASTSRVMNLALGERVIADDPDAARIFASANLNKCVVLKHTPRPHERELFSAPRRVVTKIIFPFDYNDLRLGGTSIFLKQRSFERNEEQLQRVTGATRKDMALLDLLDRLPSLDPFLVREHCARARISIPVERLALSPADVAAMQAFVHAEVRRLVLVAFRDFEADLSERFARKILTNTPDPTMRPLMDTLRMTGEAFWEGVFSWRGFLYYKWRLQAMAGDLDGLFAGVERFVPDEGMDKAFSQYLAAARPRLAHKLSTAVAYARSTIEIYNDAFAAMVEGDDASKFKRFLFDGPKLFVSLGEQVGLLDHFTSLWKYRRREGDGRMSALAYGDFLVDLDESLTATNRAARTAAPEAVPTPRTKKKPVWI